MEKIRLALFFLLVLSKNLVGQCDWVKIGHTNGTQLVGCSTVTVTKAGSAGGGTSCNIGPYLIGPGATGSFTFQFSPPATAIKVEAEAINNTVPPGGPTQEEIGFDINGSFWPLTDAGNGGGCEYPAVIAANGRLAAPLTTIASTEELIVTTPITSLKLTNYWIAGSPGGVYISVYVCCACNSSAGMIDADSISICGNGTATVPPAQQTVLDGNDLLRYILFTNPADTLGSIIATSTTPSFPFNPAKMTHGTYYYIAAIVGSGVAGNINLKDPCLDISNAIPVIWNLLPTVAFSVPNPQVCPGACKTVTATFTGTPPFVLTYQTSNSGPFIETFAANSGTFEVCAPSGQGGNQLFIQALSVSDAFCSCP